MTKLTIDSSCGTGPVVSAINGWTILRLNREAAINKSDNEFTVKTSVWVYDCSVTSIGASIMSRPPSTLFQAADTLAFVKFLSSRGTSMTTYWIIRNYSSFIPFGSCNYTISCWTLPSIACLGISSTSTKDCAKVYCKIILSNVSSLMFNTV